MVQRDVAWGHVHLCWSSLRNKYQQMNQLVMIRHKSALYVVSVCGKYVGLCSQDRFAQIASISWGVRVIEASGIMAARATRVTCPILLQQPGPYLSYLHVGPFHLRIMCGGGADVSGTSVLPHHSDVITFGALYPAFKCYSLVCYACHACGRVWCSFFGSPPFSCLRQSLEGHSAWMVGLCGTSRGVRSELEPMEQYMPCD